jgi:ubiquinone/menaquinone biosynthesis C-methylase UbiE
MMEAMDILDKLKRQKPDGFFTRHDGQILPQYTMFHDLMKKCNLYHSRGIAQKKADYARKVDGRLVRIRKILKKIGTFINVEDKLRVLDLAAGLGIESLALSHYLKTEIIALDRTIRFFDYPDKYCIRKWLKHTYDAIGWDWNTSASLRKLYLQKNIRWIRSNGEKLPFEDNSINFVLTLNAIMFFRDIVGTFKEIYRILKPGGIIYVRWTNFYGLDGCHTPGLVDIPWAHVLMSADEYYEYLATFLGNQPELMEDVKNIQRLTLADWQKAIFSAPWERLSWNYRTDLNEELIPSFVIKNKPEHLSVEDLLTETITAILRKPMHV